MKMLVRPEILLGIRMFKLKISAGTFNNTSEDIKGIHLFQSKQQFLKVLKTSASNPREAGHLIRHRRSKLGRRKVFGDTKSKSQLVRHKDVVSYQEPGRVKRAATARPERIWDYAVIPYEIDSNFRSVRSV